MSSLVIVAIPTEDDYVNKISSEKIAHMTLLFLGEADQVKNINQIVDFVGHAARRSLMRFGLEVDRRSVLGDEEADVLLFSKSKWSGFETINNFRSYLLKNDNIRTAYDSAEQFPEWIPHLTLGTPDAPAKPDERDYPGINYVNFDRIAVWVDDFEGIEFPLKAYDWDSDVAMGTVTTKSVIDNILEHRGVKSVRLMQGTLMTKDVLTHFGVKGMQWGVRRKATVGPREVIVRDTRRKVKTKGGEGHPAVPSAIRAREIGQIGKKSGLKALSDEDLNTYARRIQLEQNVARLQYNEKSRGAQFIDSFLGRQGSRLANEAATQSATKAGGYVLKKAVKRSARIAAIAAA